MTYELPPMRPPSEAYSLLLRVHRGCPWNRCAFCDAYKNLKFDRSSIRPVEDIKRDILAAHQLMEQTMDASRELGDGEVITDRVRGYMFQRYFLDIGLFPWLLRYGQPQTAFLGDSDAIILKTGDMVKILEFLHKIFPSLERVTSYGRARTIATRAAGHMEALAHAGLNRIHIGLETGDDELLNFVEKGATAAQMVEAGSRVKRAGISLSMYVMPGLGGVSRSRQHALNTAAVLNQVDPDFIRFRSFVPRQGTPLYQQYEYGELVLLPPHGYVNEIKLLVETLEVTGRVAFDHMVNPTFKQDNHLVPLLHPDNEGYKFPERKGEVLTALERGLAIDESHFIRAEQWILREHL
ncbi:MAG: radical SAM protein [Dehalococcoidia bacterium]|nr:radical SAM protein [Dehalococcoidia bacterium]